MNRPAALLHSRETWPSKPGLYIACNLRFTGTRWGLDALARVGVPLSARSQETHMDTNTLLIIILIVLVLGGGGWYGRGRWY